jgi:hypothetical protein
MPESTLCYRMNSRISKTDFQPTVQNLTEIEKDVIVQYILDLDLQEFPPSIKDVCVIADHILILQSTQCVGKLWPNCFIQQQEELHMCFSCAYNFQQALCKDPELIHT